jgi:hypothetical protein
MMVPLTSKPFIGPYYQRQVAKFLRQTIPMADAGVASDFAAARRKLPPKERHPGGILGMLMVGQNRTVQTHFRGLAERRAAALILALRLYQLDHAGSLPATLAGLVPLYLPAVPLDPMADHKVFGYSGPAAAHPYVYSVGDDGKDESASTQPIRAVPPGIDADDDIDPWLCRDAVFYLVPP